MQRWVGLKNLTHNVDRELPSTTPRPNKSVRSVLKLAHKKADSVPLTIETDGKITTAPYQGAAPPESKRKEYQKVNW